MKGSITTIDFEIIWKSIHDELSPAEQHQLDQWLADDPRNRAYYLKTEKYYASTTVTPAKPQVKLLWTQIAAQGNTKPQKSGYYGSIAACILLLLAACMGYFLWMETSNFASENTNYAQKTTIKPGNSKAVLVLPDGEQVTLGSNDSTSINQYLRGLANIQNNVVAYKESSDAESVHAFHTLTIPRGGEFQLKLSDGTQVWLNAQSSIRYPIQFDGNKRVVELTGEAYFEVAGNKEKPFEVITGKQTIRVLGTSFNINYYPEDERIISTLLEGSIRINTKDGNNTMMAPGEQVIFDIHNESLTKSEVHAENAIAWKNGEFYFQDRSLAHIMKVLGRWYNIDVFYKNGEKRDIRFTGSLKRYEQFEKVIALIEATDDVKIDIKENVIIIE